jgi:TfoX/Sxy family transcriptional regulator of competence genes
MATKRETPRWRKSSPELIERFDAALPDDPRVERRQMFGYPAAFANGQLFTGLHQEDLMVRLGDVERAKLLALPGAKPFEPMPGRTMREYAVVPPALHANRRALRAWMAKALGYVFSLPPRTGPGRAKTRPKGGSRSSAG